MSNTISSNSISQSCSADAREDHRNTWKSGSVLLLKMHDGPLMAAKFQRVDQLRAKSFVYSACQYVAVLMEQQDPFKDHTLRIQYGNRRPRNAVNMGSLSIDWGKKKQQIGDHALPQRGHLQPGLILPTRRS
jgi:hypothetical protein